MKKALFSSLALIACAVLAQAQGTFQFYANLTGANEVPPNNDPTMATGLFTLTGDVLNFRVDVPSVTFIPNLAYIQGPAQFGANGPIIFDLGGPTITPGNGFGTPTTYHFFSPFDGVFGAGPFTLSTSQISDLENGLWYVNVTSAAMPAGQLRGQLIPVPEPSTWALLCAAGVAICCRRRKR